MTLYETFRKLQIDHCAIGLGLHSTQVQYYCTPKDACIIGNAGVDGIHYCTVPGFGDLIFAKRRTMYLHKSGGRGPHQSACSSDSSPNEWSLGCSRASPEDLYSWRTV